MEQELQKVINILNREDPLDLTSAGAPSDEYIIEANLILSAYKNSSGPKDFMERFEKIFTKRFGLDFLKADQLENLRNLANKVYSEM